LQRFFIFYAKFSNKYRSTQCRVKKILKQILTPFTGENAMNSKVTTAVAVILVLAVVGLFFVSPGFQSKAKKTFTDLTQWTPENIEKDPVGYWTFLKDKAETDKKELQNTRRGLSAAMETTSKKVDEKTKLFEAGTKIAEEFADAITAANFPVTLHGKEYTADQANMQLSLTLAEVDAYKESVAKLNEISKIAEQKIQETIINIEKIDNEITVLNTKSEVFKANKIDSETLAMLQNAHTAFDGTQVLLKANPVRTISEMLASDTAPKQGERASDQRVAAYLTEYVSQKGGTAQTSPAPVAPAQNQADPVSGSKGQAQDQKSIPEAPAK
jgi:type II secretory pathway component PulM